MARATDKVKEAVDASSAIGHEAVSQDTPEIEREIEATRARMGETLEELHGKLNPSALKEQAIEQFKEAKDAIKADLATEVAEIKTILRTELQEAKDGLREATIGKVEHMVDSAERTVMQTGNTLFETVRENPIPTALVGIGIGWLFMNARARRSDGHRNRYLDSYSYPYARRRGPRRVEDMARDVEARAEDLAHRVGDRAQETFGNVTDRAKDMARQAGERAGQMEHDAENRVGAFVHDAEDTVGRYAKNAGNTAMTVARGARDQAMEWEGIIERTMQDNPLAAGAIAIALGAAVGLAFPSTELEDRYIGNIRDRAVDRAEHLAEQALDQVDASADKLADNVGRSIRGEAQGGASGAT